MSKLNERLESLFEAALARYPDAERTDYLERECPPELRQEIESLLAAHDHPDIVFADDSPRREAAPSEVPGTVIGPYKLLEPLGEGGFGTVWLAVQSEPVRRQVALKIIKLGMDTKQVVARFEVERQALALMDHPNIAKVLDAGVTDNGRPYFVMELVHGISITRFCDENKLATPERLDLFIKVCHAVQHAHQKGIIHRDLKPSNILVTLHDGVPVPNVIDFGVAKAIDRNLTDQTLFTQITTMIGTPAYMSPEQAEMSGLDVDTRSDIYSLGVLLYELLTGTTPFDAQDLLQAGFDEMRRIIRETEPPKPSTRLTQSARTTAKPPVARRSGAAHDAQPVARRSEADSQQPAAGSILKTEVPAAPGIVVDPPQERRATGLITRHSPFATDLDWIVMKCLEKDRARRYETANELAADIQAHANDEPVRARPPSAAYRFQKFVRRNKLQFAAATFGLVMLIVAVAVSSWQAVRAKRAEESAREQAKDAEAIKDFLVRRVLAVNPYVDPDPEPDPGRRPMVDRVAGAVQTEFADRPKIEAELRFALGNAYAGLADYREAANQFEKSYAIRRKELGPQHSDTLWALSFIASMYPSIGRSQEAKQLMTNALAIIRSSPHPLSSGEAEVLWTYGVEVISRKSAAEALPYLREAMVVSKQTLDPKDFRLQHKKWWIAYLVTQAGQWEEAETLWAEEIRQCEQYFGAEHPTTAHFLKGQAHLFLRIDREEEARLILERAVPIYHRTLGTDHNNGLDAEGLLAEAYEKLDRLEESAKLYSSLYPRWEKHLPSRTARDKCEEIANFFVRHRRYDEAKAVFQGMSDSFEKSPPDGSAEIAMMITATAAIKGLPAAAGVCRKYLDRFGDAPAICRTVGTALLYTGDIDGYRQAVAKVLARPVTESQWEYSNILNTAVLGTTEFTPDQVSRCEALIQAVERGLATATEDQQNSGCRAIGGILLRLGRLTESLDYLERAEKKFPSGIGRARVLVLTSLCLHRLGGGTVEARAAFDEAEAIMQPELLDHLNEREGLLRQDECTYLIHRREAMALLGGTQSNQ